MASGVKIVAAGVVAVGALALAAAAGATIASNEAEKKHTKQVDAISCKHKEESAEASACLDRETARREEAESTVAELRSALVGVKDAMLLQRMQMSKVELEIEALVKRSKVSRPTFDVIFVLDVSGSF